MNRQRRRRIAREWKKIKIGKNCTKFVEQNGLFKLPHILFFRAVKIGDYLMCVYNVGLFGFNDGYDYREHAVICHFIGSVFRSLGSVKLGFVSEEDLEKGEEIQL